LVDCFWIILLLLQCNMPTFNCGARVAVSIVTWLWVEWFRVQIPVRAKQFLLPKTSRLAQGPTHLPIPWLSRV
jgi:hypothetical protein